MFALWIECFKMGLRELWRHKLRSFLTMIGIIMGVSVVIICVTVVQGVKGALIEDIRKAGKNMIIVITKDLQTAGGVRGGGGAAASSTVTIADTAAVQLECDAVAAACASHQIHMQVVSEKNNFNVPIMGVTHSYVAIRNWGVSAGRDLEPFDIVAPRRVCLIGQTAQRELFGDENPLNKHIRINHLSFKVVGLLEPKGFNPLGMDEDNTIIIPLRILLQNLIGIRYPSGFLCSATSDADVDLAVDQVTALLRQRHKLEEDEDNDFTITTLKEKEEQARTISNKMTLLMFFIALVSLVVGGVGIMNIMLVAVTERTREIGIRMAIGASGKAINRQFLVEAGVISSVGGIAGILLGVGLAILIANKIGVTPLISPAIVLIAFGFSVGVGVVFGLLPARRAASLNPIEALRHD
ncbi:MAG: ABC transporter permease [Planctomycetota bacterium]|nr:ABC transporter permease [Planctomycetota bacterium]